MISSSPVSSTVFLQGIGHGMLLLKPRAGILLEVDLSVRPESYYYYYSLGGGRMIFHFRLFKSILLIEIHYAFRYLI